jgi:hypothetical protein
VSDLRDIIPGYREALEQEELQRNVAFLDVPELICGIEVSPFTLNHLCRLQCISSPFVCGGVMSPADVALFLWAVSPEYHPKARLRRWLFIRRARGLNYADTVKAIEQYLADAFADRTGGGSRGFSPPNWSGYASICASLAAEYGWSVSQIMAMPVKQVWQFLRIVERRTNPKATFSNRRSEAVRRDWLDTINKRN